MIALAISSWTSSRSASARLKLLVQSSLPVATSMSRAEIASAVDLPLDRARQHRLRSELLSGRSGVHGLPLEVEDGVRD